MVPGLVAELAMILIGGMEGAEGVVRVHCVVGGEMMKGVVVSVGMVVVAGAVG
jgi:hypothetical protein